MPYEKPLIQQSNNPYRKSTITTDKVTRTIYYGKVVQNTDSLDAGRIKVRIKGLDDKITNYDSLPWAYPLLPKFYHGYPKPDEIVRILIEDPNTPYVNRFWVGPVISQPQFIKFESYETALGGTDKLKTKMDIAPSTIPDADGVYPELEDIAIVGRVNTDIILKVNEVHFRAGKHENDEPLKLNVKNPSHISMVYEKFDDTDAYRSSTLILSDKIGLIAHSGNPKFKAAKIETEDRNTIFENGHPIARGDVLVEALNIIRRAIVNHIHDNSTPAPDKTALIQELEKIDFNAILQENIVIN